MLTQYEAAKLQRDMRRELDGTTGALLKSVVGLLVVVMLALLGPTLDRPRVADAAQAGTQGSTQPRL